MYEACDEISFELSGVEIYRPLKSISVVSGLFSLTETTRPLPFKFGYLLCTTLIVFKLLSNRLSDSSSCGVRGTSIKRIKGRDNTVESITVPLVDTTSKPPACSLIIVTGNFLSAKYFLAESMFEVTSQNTCSFLRVSSFLLFCNTGDSLRLAADIICCACTSCTVNKRTSSRSPVCFILQSTKFDMMPIHQPINNVGATRIKHLTI